jgi:hypothetical protein
MTQKASVRILSVALALGGSTDLLFYGKSIGVSMLIFVLLLLCALFTLSIKERVPAAPRNLWLIFPLLVFATMVFVRANATLTTLNISAVFVLLGLISFFYAAGRVEVLGPVGYVVALALAAYGMLTRPVPTVAVVAKSASAQRQRAQLAAPVARGFMLALPVLALFTALLSSADSIFAGYVSDLFKFNYLSSAPEMMSRISLSLGAAWLVAGGLFYALGRRSAATGHDRESELTNVQILRRSVGFVEGAMVLVLVNLLFAVFAWIQFAYLFFGEAARSMHYEVYREYVRRGFGELLAVSVLSMLLILGVRWIAHQETRREERIFNALDTLMIALVGVMLVSAFQRMLVWESVDFYINTQLRLYVRVFIVWLALLFGWLFFTLWLHPKRFAIGAFVSVIGYMVTINYLNPDADVAAYNLKRADDLSTRYLYLLSDDAVPALVEGLSTTTYEVQSRVREDLMQRLQRLQTDPNRTRWQSFHLARHDAYDTLSALYESGKLDNEVLYLTVRAPYDGIDLSSLHEEIAR